MMSWICTVMLLARAAPAVSGHAAPAPGCCDVCGVEMAAIANLIDQLQRHPDRRCRERAAHQLRRYEWTCHPEAVCALAAALLTDCDKEVREEAAQSLAKMAPCLPPIHAALVRSSRCERNFCTRLWVRKALKKLDRRCQGECSICQARGPGVLPGPGAVLPSAEPIGPLGLPYGPPSGGPMLPLEGTTVPLPVPVSPPSAPPRDGMPPLSVPPTEIPPPAAPPGTAPFQFSPTSAARYGLPPMGPGPPLAGPTPRLSASAGTC